MNLPVSVVVPTYQRPRSLQCCLEALLEQDLDPSCYEIIVADDADCPDTCALVTCLSRTTGCTPPIRYVRVEGKHGPAAARNAGWRAARGAIIAFTDDDCVPQCGWLRAGLDAFASDVAGVSGRIVVPRNGVSTDYEQNAACLERSVFATANCFFRRCVLDRVGGFDERFTAAWREDTDLQFTLIERGAHLTTSPDAVVVHPIRPAPWGVSLRQQRKSIFNALLYKKHPALYRRHVQAGPPYRYYATVLALLSGVVFIARQHRRRGQLGLAIWFLLTLQFTSRRLRGTSHAPMHVLEMVVTSCLIPPLAIFWRLAGAIRFRVLFF